MEEERTDVSLWRLKVDKGRQVWHYLSPKEAQDWPQTDWDRYWLELREQEQKAPLPLTPETAIDAARNGFEFFKNLQTEDGHWAGEYGGPMFLIPGLVITMFITGAQWPAGYKTEIVRYLKNRAHKVDGGWGIHIEGVSTVFGTALNYVALRLLGVPKNDPVCLKARAHLMALGGASGIPSWGKFWLSVLNVYSWDGCHPIPPELWMLPYSVTPFHPGRMWCHSRLVYLPMGYLYGIRFQAPLYDIVRDLRDELYPIPYEKIKWNEQRNNVASVDLFAPHSKLLDFLNNVLSVYEVLPNSFIRNKALEVALDQIRAEDRNTKYLDIGPVNKVMNTLVTWIVDGPYSDSFKAHIDRIPDFMWMSPEGMMMNGTNGSQLWDTAFAVQALVESGIANDDAAKPYMLKALDYLDVCQIRHNMDNYEKYYRQTSRGAWPFSTRDQSYTVSDCTSEGLKAVIYLQEKLDYVAEKIDRDRLRDAVDVLLSMQNPDGGFASYEKIRSYEALELLNPAEVFGKIMIEYSYPECTTAVLLSLTTYRKFDQTYRYKEVKYVPLLDDPNMKELIKSHDSSTIDRAVEYIRKSQLPDGSWYGSWGICFTYAMFFAMESLASVGETYSTSERIRKACSFLISKQQEDGGWGESYKSCETGVYCHHEKSQVVQTAWAVLSLMAANFPEKGPVEKGVKLIMSRQNPNGEWLQEAIEGDLNLYQIKTKMYSHQ